MQTENEYNLELFKSQMGMASALKALKAQPKAGKAAEGSDAANPADSKRWKASLDFEAMFLGQMYKGMRQSSMSSGLTEMSPGRDIFTGMLDQEYANMHAKNPVESGPEGMRRAASKVSNTLAAQIYRAMLRNEGAESPASENTGASPLAPAAKSPSAPAPLVPDMRMRASGMPFSAAANLSRSQSLVNKKSAAAPLSAIAASVLDPIVDAASETYGVAKSLIRSVIGQESANRQYAVSPVGAKGLMQLMDSTARELGVKNSFNAHENVMGGTKYLKQMLDRYAGDEKLALAAYNAGPGSVDRFRGMPPFSETKNYVERVLKAKGAMDAEAAGAAVNAKAVRAGN